MARTYAKVCVDVWSDDDWIDLDPLSKLVYLFLLSQPKMRSCGVIDMAARRWAPRVGISVDELDTALVNLEARRYVAVDHSTEELAVRTFVKHDAGDTQNWKVWRGVWSSLSQVESKQLQRFVFDNMPDAAMNPAAKPIERPSEREPSPDRTPFDWSSDDQSDAQFDQSSNGNAIGSGKSLSLTTTVTRKPPTGPDPAKLGLPPPPTADTPQGLVARTIYDLALHELGEALGRELIDNVGGYFATIRKRITGERASLIAGHIEEHPDATAPELLAHFSGLDDLVRGAAP